MTIATKDGSVIVKDGAVAERCECCSPCLPTQFPDFIEVDIQSDSEADEYGSFRYRVGNNAGYYSGCEADFAESYLAFGIKSQTYVLQHTLTIGLLRIYECSTDGVTVTAQVVTYQSQTSPWVWPGNFANKFGPGIYLRVQPFRIVAHVKRWRTASGLSDPVATESDLKAVSAELLQSGSSATTTGGILHIKTTLGSSDSNDYPMSRGIYQDSVFPCIGGNEAFGRDANSFGSSQGTLGNNGAALLAINCSYSIPGGAGSNAAGLSFTDSLEATNKWDNFSFSTCGKNFVLPYLLSASGVFAASNSGTFSFDRDGATINASYARYTWRLNRQVTVTAVRGKMNDGAEVRLV